VATLVIQGGQCNLQAQWTFQAARREAQAATAKRSLRSVRRHWCLNQRLPASERQTQWQLGKRLNKKAAIAAESSLASERLLGRNVLADTVSYVARAKGVIEGTAQGQLPVV
jgi:hypothetical protein